jgi:FkbM family methyltransferase
LAVLFTLAEIRVTSGAESCRETGGMFVRTLRTLRLGLRGTVVGRLLRQTGIMALGRTIYQRLLLGKGVHQANLMGCELRFAVASPREIRRIDSFVNEEVFVGKMIEAVQPGDVFYDIGANVGTVSLIIASKHRDTDVTVHAFEPEPANVDHLRKNIELNNASNVQAHDLAFGAESGTTRLFVEGETGSGCHSLVAKSESSAPSIEVRVVTGSEFAREIGSPPDIMKIDVEGGEMQVLLGMAELFDDARVRDVFIEVHPARLERAGTSARELQRWLEDRGYEVVWSHDRGLEAHQHYRRKSAPS